MRNPSLPRARGALAAMVLTPALVVTGAPAMAQTEPFTSSPLVVAPVDAESPTSTELSGWADGSDVYLSWQPVDGVTAWHLSDTTGAWTTTLEADASEHVFTDVTPGDHLFELRAVNAAGAESAPASVQVFVERSVPRPTGLAATVEGRDVVLTWDPIEGATGWGVGYDWNAEYLSGPPPRTASPTSSPASTSSGSTPRSRAARDVPRPSWSPCPRPPRHRPPRWAWRRASTAPPSPSPGSHRPTRAPHP
ncbi:hypothetical protein [Nocardioides yefusunii]|uniref:Fibronectin type III domain-containing protein n=1 Tax=Nocardioides yefusunii TaxID=2500546 RepID=A0ABW1QU78_9ACTN|nr:hypothetical protein [Nocardioides yefusunii]